jgi:hypothetical protein
MFKKLYNKLFGKKVTIDALVTSIDLTSEKLHIIQIDTGKMPSSKAEVYIKEQAELIREASKLDNTVFKFIAIGKRS